MPRKPSKLKRAEITKFPQLKTSSGGSGKSGGGDGNRSVSLMGLLVRQRQSNVSDTLTSNETKSEPPSLP